MSDRVGQQVGNYRLTKLLGRGGFAEVYLAEHVLLNTPVAIKLLQTQLLATGKEQFLEEARTIARLKHPHIVRLLYFDSDTDTGGFYLVMDYAPNGNLRQRHPKGAKLPSATILHYVSQVAPALQYAHDNKVMHLDVKPENMLLGEQNEVLLSDFGLSTVVHSSMSMKTQAEAGTIYYMAPEQIRGKPRPASDQYALAITVYHWVCGVHPFVGNTTIDIAMQHVNDAPAPLRNHVSTLSNEVEQVVLKALAKDPQQRFASVEAFATALEQAYQAKPYSPVAQSLEAMLLREPLSPANEGNANPPSQSSLRTEAVTGQWSQQVSPVNTTPTVPVALPAPSAPELSLSDEFYRSPRRITRRMAVVGLAGLVVIGSGITTWLVLSQGSHIISSGVSHTATPVPRFSPTATQSPVTTQPPTSTAAPVAFKPGGISFIGPVKSVTSISLVMSAPNGQSYTLAITAQTDRSAFGGSLPAVGTSVNMDSIVNPDGSFTATILKPAVAGDPYLNVIAYTGITTSAVGADRVLHFTIGTKSYTYTIPAPADLVDFGGNAQAIGINVSVRVKVQVPSNTVVSVGNASA